MDIAITTNTFVDFYCISTSFSRPDQVFIYICVVIHSTRREPAEAGLFVLIIYTSKSLQVVLTYSNKVFVTEDLSKYLLVVEWCQILQISILKWRKC